jgi:hypothetical protein
VIGQVRGKGAKAGFECFIRQGSLAAKIQITKAVSTGNRIEERGVERGKESNLQGSVLYKQGD